MAGEAAATIWEETGSEGYEESSGGSWEEFVARSDGGFEATRPVEATRLVEAKGDGDVWCATTITAAAPADMAGAAISPGIAGQPSDLQRAAKATGSLNQAAGRQHTCAGSPSTPAAEHQLLRSRSAHRRCALVRESPDEEGLHTHA